MLVPGFFCHEAHQMGLQALGRRRLVLSGFVRLHCAHEIPDQKEIPASVIVAVFYLRHLHRDVDGIRSPEHLIDDLVLLHIPD